MINKIILASQSQIRKKIFEEKGFTISTEVSLVDEEEIKKSMQSLELETQNDFFHC